MTSKSGDMYVDVCVHEQKYAYMNMHTNTARKLVWSKIKALSTRHHHAMLFAGKWAPACAGPSEGVSTKTVSCPGITCPDAFA